MDIYWKFKPRSVGLTGGVFGFFVFSLIFYTRPRLIAKAFFCAYGFIGIYTGVAIKYEAIQWERLKAIHSNGFACLSPKLKFSKMRPKIAAMPLMATQVFLPISNSG